MWNTIPNAPRYEVNSDTLEVRNTVTRKILQPAIPENGYKQFCLTRDGDTKKTFYLHRILAELFVPRGSPDASVVNHKNLNKTDNRICNLEWVTPSQNVSHWVASPKFKEDIERRKTKLRTRKRERLALKREQMIQEIKIQLESCTYKSAERILKILREQQ